MTGSKKLEIFLVVKVLSYLSETEGYKRILSSHMCEVPLCPTGAALACVSWDMSLLAHHMLPSAS